MSNLLRHLCFGDVWSWYWVNEQGVVVSGPVIPAADAFVSHAGSGTPGQPGRDGVDGYTPVKGVDYFDGLPGTPGAKGDTGDAGLQGGPGSQGTQGTQGIKGDTGVMGSQGVPGDVGAQGTQGVKGDTGDVGSQGTQGVKGDTGDTGAQGTQGIQGVQGNTGAQGSPGNNAPSYGALSNGTTAMAFATAAVRKVTPTATATFTTTVPAAGTFCVLLILTSGTTSYTITFGTGFKPTATLATGTTSGRVFSIHFTSDGTNLYESGRTAAMVA